MIEGKVVQVFRFREMRVIDRLHVRNDAGGATHPMIPDSLRLPGWTLWSLFRNAKLGGWVVGHSVSRGGWSDAVIVVYYFGGAVGHASVTKT